MNARFSRPRSAYFPDSPVLLCFCAVLIGVLCTVLLLLLGCAAACTQNDPAAWILPVSLVTLLLSAVVCGIVCGRGSSPLLCGFCGGGAFMLLLTLLSFLPLGDAHTEIPLLGNVFLHAAGIGCSVLGAFLSKKRKPRPQRLFKNRRF